MPRTEGWAFLCLMGCLLAVSLSLTLLAGAWQAAGCLLGVLLGVLSGGLYGLSVPPHTGAGPGGGADTASHNGGGGV
jgi:hypothetical protein